MESGTEARSKNTFEHVSVNGSEKVAQLARLICPDVIRVRVEDRLRWHGRPRGLRTNRNPKRPTQPLQ
jgi:hypothetical protein